MDAAAVTQLVTVVVAAMGIVWHQQHSINHLRKETREDIQALHNKIDTANQQNREDFRALREDHNTLSGNLNAAALQLTQAIAQNGQRLARIEGHLGIGILSAPSDTTDTRPS